MMIKTEWNSGNFTLAHSAEVTKEQLAEAAALGLRWMNQRNSKHDKILGGFTTDRALADKPKGKGPWRKKGWKRDAVDFTPAMADALASIYGEARFPDDSETSPHRIQQVTKITLYEGAESPELKYREAIGFAEKHESDADGLDAWAKRFCGFAGATHGEDGEFSREMLAAIHEKWTAMKLALAAGA